MKRFIFWSLMFAGVLVSTYVTVMLFATGSLFVNPFVPELTFNDMIPSAENLELCWLFLRYIVENIGDLFQMPFVDVMPTYGFLLFLLINAYLMLSMLFALLFSLFRLRRVKRFYAGSVLFFVSALLLVGGFGYLVYELIDAGVAFGDVFSMFTWWFWVPIGMAWFLMIFALIFKKTEREF